MNEKYTYTCYLDLSMMGSSMIALVHGGVGNAPDMGLCWARQQYSPIPLTTCWGRTW